MSILNQACIIKTSSPRETQRLGEELGKLLRPGDLVGLVGELGSGKTCLVQGIAKGLGIKEVVTSPSFVLLNVYQGRLPLYHFDAFRLSNLREMEELGYEEYFFNEGVTVIEWAEKIEGLLPPERLMVELMNIGQNKRKVKLIAYGKGYEDILQGIFRSMEGKFFLGR